MKKNIMRLLKLFLLELGLTVNCLAQSVTFPFSQFTYDVSHNDYSHWTYPSELEMNHSFINKPQNESWELWYKKLNNYRNEVRSKLGKQNPSIVYHLEKKKKGILQIDAFGYDLNLRPKEEIEFKLSIKGVESPIKGYVSYQTKTKGFPTSAVIRKSYLHVDSIIVNGANNEIVLKSTIPSFSTDSLIITPVIEWVMKDTVSSSSLEVMDVILKIPSTEKRKNLSQKISDYLVKQSQTVDFNIPSHFTWAKQNFVMGFAFAWDKEIFDPIAKRFTIDTYCDKMDKEFGGMQSVVWWHTYPNIGIDEKNQFDYFDQLPGGIDSLKKVVETFHKRGVKVFITYNPWDTDTRRPSGSDEEMLAEVLAKIDADGIYLDTWKSSLGVNSIFASEKNIREACEAKGKKVAFSTEIHPQLKDLVGIDALLCTWGQEIKPYNGTGLSHVKWVKPQHIQHFINRGKTDRTKELGLAWINGQGIQVWENVFGTMKLWNASDRQHLRKMNAIWKTYGQIYLTDSIMPFVEGKNAPVEITSFTKNGSTMLNFRNVTTVTMDSKFEVSKYAKMRFFDIWNGKELMVEKKGNQNFINVNVEKLGAVYITSSLNNELSQLLEKQKKESSQKNLSKGNDTYAIEKSLKYPSAPPKPSRKSTLFNKNFIQFEPGNYSLDALCKWREGGDYQDPEFDDNHAEKIKNVNGEIFWVHNYVLTTSGFGINSRVVTNKEFMDYIKVSGYVPQVKENYLKHWKNGKCPDSLLNAPVTYVSLEDARSFAAWYGLRLPTEWEWQLAAEKFSEKFVYNEVFEWNESERNDGYNRSVSLRGGCSRWKMFQSWWYLPTARYGGVVGGPQSAKNHTKYFLMHDGIDRASTIGFRCVILNQ